MNEELIEKIGENDVKVEVEDEKRMTTWLVFAISGKNTRCGLRMFWR